MSTLTAEVRDGALVGIVQGTHVLNPDADRIPLTHQQAALYVAHGHEELAREMGLRHPVRGVPHRDGGGWD